MPQRIEAGRYRSMIAELFANAGRMGPRQLGFIRRALTEAYKEAGVLTNDPEVQGEYQKRWNWFKKEEELVPNEWWVVRDGTEQAVIDAARAIYGVPGSVTPDTRLATLTPVDLQALAVHRSKLLSMARIVEKLDTYKKRLPPSDQASRTSLEGVLLRLEQFGEGQMARQYGPGPDTLAVEDLGLLGGEDPWGITVIEGGSEMDEYPKAALLSLLSSVLYFDAIARRREMLNGVQSFPPMQIFFEEANKVLTGVSGGAASDQGSSDGSSPVSVVSLRGDNQDYLLFFCQGYGSKNIEERCHCTAFRVSLMGENDQFGDLRIADQGQCSHRVHDHHLRLELARDHLQIRDRLVEQRVLHVRISQLVEAVDEVTQRVVGSDDVIGIHHLGQLLPCQCTHVFVCHLAGRQLPGGKFWA